MSQPILEVSGLQKFFPIKKGILRKHVGNIQAMDQVSFSIQSGETLGLVGESGCGKSTLGKAIIRLYEPTQGTIYFQGIDYTALRGPKLRAMRKDIQLIFQDPFSSLDPRMTVGQILMEPFRIHRIGSRAEQTELVRELLKSVGLDPSQLNRYPHEFSGGQRQRISIARSIALKPKLVIADEPVSALDVSVQAQILNLLSDLREQLGLTYLFISHDLSVIEHFCDRVAVMYLGKIVELADRDCLFSSPLHPYTDALMKSIPKLGAGKTKAFVTLQGEVPSPINPPSGCAFHPRCPRKLDRCSEVSPVLLPSPGNSKQNVACWNPVPNTNSRGKI